MRTRTRLIALFTSVVAGCATDPGASPAVDEPLVPAKGDGVSNPSPHYATVTACDAALEASDDYATYWKCVYDANVIVATELGLVLDDNVAGDYEEVEKDYEQMCRVAVLRSTKAEQIVDLCGVAQTRDFARLIDTYVKFRDHERVGMALDTTHVKGCYDAYAAAYPGVRTSVEGAELAESLERCVDDTIEQLSTSRIVPALTAVGASASEINELGVAMQHFNITSGWMCGSFAHTVAPGRDLGNRLMLTARCQADAKAAALHTVVYFHDTFADRVASRREFSATPDVAIPDGNDTGIDVDLAVSGVVGPKALQVGVEITHSFPSDLVLELRKDGRPIKTLFDHGEVATENLMTKFALTAAEAGSDPNGTWTLHVTDPWSVDAGRIKRVTLSFE